MHVASHVIELKSRALEKKHLNKSIRSLGGRTKIRSIFRRAVKTSDFGLLKPGAI